MRSSITQLIIIPAVPPFNYVEGSLIEAWRNQAKEQYEQKCSIVITDTKKQHILWSEQRNFS